MALENPIGLSPLFTASSLYSDCMVVVAQANHMRGFAETLQVS